MKKVFFSCSQSIVSLFLIVLLFGLNLPWSVFAEDTGSGVLVNEVVENTGAMLEDEENTENIEQPAEFAENLEAELLIENKMETQSGSEVLSDEQTASGLILINTGSGSHSQEKEVEKKEEKSSKLSEEKKERLEKTSVEIEENVSAEQEAELLEKAEEIKEKVEEKSEIKQKIAKYKEQKEVTKTKVEVRQKEIQDEIVEKTEVLKKNNNLNQTEKLEKQQEIVEEVLEKHDEPLVELQREIKQQKELLVEINEAMQTELEEIIEKELTVEEQDLVEIEPNFLFELQDEVSLEVSLEGDTEGVVPNDPQYASQWSLKSIMNDKLRITNESSENTYSPIIALIDTGVDYTHEDLQGQFWKSENCVDDLGESVEGGCLLGGYDFVDEDSDPFASDGYAHGTQVAGILVAKTNNNVGISSLLGLIPLEGDIGGVRPQVMALRVADNGILEQEKIIRAVYFAVNNGADVINMSFGGPTYSENLKEAIAFAESRGVVVVAASGNYGTNNDVSPIYPASYELENIISVTALDRNDNLAEFSNYGQNSVDIGAPGVNVLTTGLNDTYSTVSGTSFAVPFVVGSYCFEF